MEATPAAPVGKSLRYEPEHDQALKACLDRGLSFSEIATEMSAKFGRSFTRNMLIGRAHRLGLSAAAPRPKASNVVKLPRPKRVGRPYHWRQDRAQAMAKSVCAEIVPLDVTLDNLGEGMCRYPYGDVAPYLFCGHPQLKGFSYCPSHWRLCWQPPRPREMQEAAE